MGSGIAAEAARHGYAVTLEDVTEELARAGLERARHALDGAVERKIIGSADRDEALRNIDVAIGLRRADTAQVVVEAAPEKLALKRELFHQLEETASPTAILATNTSSLPVTSIASVLKDPGRAVGIHFFNPVLRMPLVELIPGLSTRPEVVARPESSPSGSARPSSSPATPRGSSRPGRSRCSSMKRSGCSTRGLLPRRSSIRPTSSASTTRWDPSSSPTSSDSIPPSPSWTSSGKGSGTRSTRACPLLRSMVEAGKLGRKTGEGFYTYPNRDRSSKGGVP